MKYLHLFPLDKFTVPYIDFINSNFKSSEHLFLIIGKNTKGKMEYKENVKHITNDLSGLKMLFLEVYKSKKIFLHGLFISKLIIFFLFQPWLLKKSNWLIWGGDLYFYKFRNKNLKNDLYELMRKFVIKNMAGLITHVEGDYKLAHEWYGVKGKYFYSFMYPSNVYKEFDLSASKKNSKKNTTYIQVGNSASLKNNHIEIFNVLKQYKQEAIKIICPLSYGNKLYKEKVIKEGYELFGDKFQPIENFMPFNEYLKILAEVDVAIFNHKRQQAMGNITTLIGLGKKVYIRDDITTWDFCNDHNLTVFSINNEHEDLLSEIASKTSKKNQKNVKNHFNEEKLKMDWEFIFNYK